MSKFMIYDGQSSSGLHNADGQPAALTWQRGNPLFTGADEFTVVAEEGNATFAAGRLICPAAFILPLAV